MSIEEVREYHRKRAKVSRDKRKLEVQKEQAELQELRKEHALLSD